MPRLKIQGAATDAAQQVPGARQRELLQWLAQGVDLREAARRLNRRPQVVQHHLTALLARLGVATPAEALQKLASGAAPAAEPGAEPAADESAAAPQAAAEPAA